MNLRKPVMNASTAHSTVPRPTTTGNSPLAQPGPVTPTPLQRAPQRKPLRPVTSGSSEARRRTSPKKAGSRPTKSRQPKLERRYHQTIRRIDPWSVLKVSVCFYLCALLVFLVAGVILWFAADFVGLIDNVESFAGDLFDDKGFKFFPSEILRAATLLGLVFAALATVMTVLATGFYNLFSDLIGGIEITVAEES